MNWVLATEDALSQAVGLRLLGEQGIVPSQTLMREGAGYLRDRVRSWQNVARRQPLLLLTDLDRKHCPSALQNDWFGEQRLAPWLCFRVAVREVESWLLADQTAIERLWQRKCTLPPSPETLPDPKQYLLALARRAPRRLRDDLVRDDAGVLRMAPGYNARLSAWVIDAWDPALAAQRAPSLARARMRVAEFAARARTLGQPPGARGLP